MADWNGLPPDEDWMGFHWLMWQETELPVLWIPDQRVWSFGYMGTTPQSMTSSGAKYLQPIPRPSERKPKAVPANRQ